MHPVPFGPAAFEGSRLAILSLSVLHASCLWGFLAQLIYLSAVFNKVLCRLDWAFNVEVKMKDLAGKGSRSIVQ